MAERKTYFEPAMLGLPDYNLMGAAIFLGWGDAARAELFRASGYENLDAALGDRLMVHPLRH